MSRNEIKITTSLEDDPELNDIFVLDFSKDWPSSEMRVGSMCTSTIAIFRQSKYDARDRILKGDICKVSVSNKKNTLIKRSVGRHQVFYLIVYVSCLEILVTSEQRKERLAEFKKVYSDFFGRYRKKMRVINAYVDYRPLTFSKEKVSQDYVLGNVDKYDLESLFRKELMQN